MDRKKFITLSGMAATAFIFPLSSCKKGQTVENALTAQEKKQALKTDSIQTAGLLFSKFRTDKGAYLLNETVKLTFEVKNTSANSVTLTDLHVFIKDISNTSATFTLTVSIANNIVIAAGQTYSVAAFTIWTVPSYALLDAFGIYVGATLQGGQTIPNTYATFFRAVSASTLLNYKITNSTYNGLSIQALDGGLSAEYGVEKAAEVLTQGVSHSWVTSAAGYGPNSVYGTQDFFDRSVNYTINYYNQTLGSSTHFETVIIAPGLPSVPYLSRVMKAPVLPLHYLVSVNTVKEIISILNYNNEVKNYSTYSTLGYDGSVAMAVAWIKMLSLPQQYIDFLNQHNVKNVIILGTNGGTAGEGTAKKILYNNNPLTGYNNGDLYLMYPGGGTSSDFSNLYNKLVDLHDYDASLETNYRQVSDWESGVVNEQITNFTSQIKTNTGVQEIRQITAVDTLDLYDLATYLTLTFMQKNASVFTAGGNPVLGVAMNPYLLAHPTYESKIRYVPLLFWQGNPASSTVSRITNQLQQTIQTYFPAINMTSLNYWVNTCKNFAGASAANNLKSALQAANLNNITMNDNSKDEVWNPGDGMGTECEIVAANILAYNTPQSYKAWDNSLLSLTPSDLDALGTRHTNITVGVL